MYTYIPNTCIRNTQFIIKIHIKQYLKPCMGLYQHYTRKRDASICSTRVINMKYNTQNIKYISGAGNAFGPSVAKGVFLM